METKISMMRKEYSDKPLLEEQLLRDPSEQFLLWFREAVDAELYEPNAMVLATHGLHGMPSARVVLLKELHNGGFVFFTNYESRKGEEIDHNPMASLLFYWPELHRQVRVEGRLEKTTEQENQEYFSLRPRGAQVGAWASRQSTALSSRQDLEENVRTMEERFNGNEVPCPPYWGGYRLKPSYLEFWQGRRSRLHDRLVYEKEGGEWRIKRLAP